MTVLVHYEVTPPDSERFLRTAKKYAPLTEQEGGRVIGLYRLESDPSRFLLLEEWASHQAMHIVSEKYGDDFNREAGTEGVEWETKVWTPVEAEERA